MCAFPQLSQPVIPAKAGMTGLRAKRGNQGSNFFSCINTNSSFLTSVGMISSPSSSKIAFIKSSEKTNKYYSWSRTTFAAISIKCPPKVLIDHLMSNCKPRRELRTLYMLKYLLFQAIVTFGITSASLSCDGDVPKLRQEMPYMDKITDFIEIDQHDKKSHSDDLAVGANRSA